MMTSRMTIILTMNKGLTSLAAGLLVLGVAGCEKPVDFDLRGKLGNTLDTAPAALQPTAQRPRPDGRGIISYPGYQVAVARRGDTVAALAQRIGANAGDLARYNGMQTGDPLRQGEVLALPARVAEPAGGPIRPATDVTDLAEKAIETAEARKVETSVLEPASTTASSSTSGTARTSGLEPVRHKVARGETAYSIARLYNVSVRSLADWNGLGSDLAVREGQFLLIPVALGTPTRTAATTQPGQGTATPTPPSATQPLPEDETPAVASAPVATSAPDLSTPAKASSSARMLYPIKGAIVREYEKGRNEGIDIAATPGASVKAAEAGLVAAVTKDTNGVPIIVVKHDAELLTVYSNVGDVAVKKGDQVGRGQTLARTRADGASAVHFEVRKGFDSVDPLPYLK